jgi:hypothetical protein
VWFQGQRLIEERIVGVTHHSHPSRLLTPIDDRHSVPALLSAPSASGDGDR